MLESNSVSVGFRTLSDVELEFVAGGFDEPNQIGSSPLLQIEIPILTRFNEIGAGGYASSIFSWMVDNFNNLSGMTDEQLAQLDLDSMVNELIAITLAHAGEGSDFSNQFNIYYDSDTDTFLPTDEYT